jgi:ankyrin repeat protein
VLYPNWDAYSRPEHPTKGLTPLDISAMRHDPYIFEVLLPLSTEVNINDVDEEGFTVLHRLSTEPTRYIGEGITHSDEPYRCAHGWQGKFGDVQKTVLRIQDLGGDLNMLTTPDKQRAGGVTLPSYTPLMLAVLQSQVETARALIKAGASVDAENDRGETALFLYQNRFNPNTDVYKIAELLVEAGINISHRNKNGSSALMAAAQIKQPDVVDLLLSNGADIHELDVNTLDFDYECNVFMILANEGSLDETEVLRDRTAYDLKLAQMIKKHVFTNRSPEEARAVSEHANKGGKTMLHQFVSCRKLHCVQTLLEHNVPVNPQMHEYSTLRAYQFPMTPLDVAVNSKDWFLKAVTRASTTYIVSKDTAEQRIQVWDQIIELLQAHGGISAATLQNPFE